MTHEPIRVLYSRSHTTIHAGVGVFLAGPTPDEDTMPRGWRRKVVAALLADPRLCPCMTVVVPEPESCRWADIVTTTGRPRHDDAVNKQIQWEWQYLELCRTTAIWLPTYWSAEASTPFPANIGPTSRWEFGYWVARWERESELREVIVGSPEDAEGVKWARYLARSRGLTWHTLERSRKGELVAPSFVEGIQQALLRRKWCGC